MFEDDQRLGEMLAVLRQAGRIAVFDFEKRVPAASRFSVSADEQERAVFPELTKALRLSEKIAEGEVVFIRTPKVIEVNYAGNLRYPYLGQANTSEWYSDKYDEVYDDYRLVGGNSDFGGLASLFYCWYGAHYSRIAFRPLVVFPSKT